MVKAPHRMTTKPVGRQVLTDQVFEAILAMLLDNQVPAGSSLTIDRLAREFEVSTTPVREALARLESTGMVRRAALRGYTVAPALTEQEVRNLLAARRLLEPVLAALATENLDEQLIETVTLHNEELDRSRSGGDTFAGFRPYWRADEAFHRSIAEAVGNESMLRMYQAIEGQAQRFRLLVHEEMSGEHTVGEHRAIIDALASGSATAAAQAMTRHIDGITQRALDLPRFHHASSNSD